MRIDVDVRTLSTRNGGISYYTFGLWSAFIEQYPETDVRFFTHSALLPDFPLPSVRRIPIPQRWGGDYLWQEWAFPLVANRSSAIPFGADFFLSGNHGRRGAFMVYDLMFLNSPNPRYREAMLGRVERSIRAGHLLVTISEFCRSQIMDYFQLSEDRVRVVYSGIDALPDSKPRKIEVDVKPVLLFVSELSHRKNVVALLEAVAFLFRQGDDFEIHFVGKQTADQADIERAAASLGLKEDARLQWHGWVSAAKKNELWQKADLLLFPSRDEGFGMPAIEAMARGIPVVTSDGGALPEVVGDAALIAPLAGDGFVERLATNIRRGLSDMVLRELLAEKGFINARRFLWTENAKRLHGIMEELND